MDLGSTNSNHGPVDFGPAAALAPLRDNVSLIDPCSGQLSAGAEADSGIHKRKNFIDRVYAPSDLWVPAGVRNRPQTPPIRPSAVPCHTGEDKLWNSRAMPESALRARLGGWSSEERLTHGSFKVSAKSHGSDVRTSVLPDWVNKAAQRYIYTSAAQRGYEDVDWDSKLPPRIKPPATTLEKMADPVNHHLTLKRYNSRPELWQAIGPLWNSRQIHATYYVKKPITFTSPCTKSGQIPLYCGVVGSENMDNVDNPEEDFTPLTLLRTTVPPYTPTAHRTTIPGYTGKALHNRPQTTNVCLPILAFTHLTTGSSSGPPTFGRKAPLSRMVTTVPPCNPFIRPVSNAHPT